MKWAYFAQGLGSEIYYTSVWRASSPLFLAKRTSHNVLKISVCVFPAPLEVRLVGSGLNSRGRLEVAVNGTWGTVCKDDFEDDNAAATVACHMLGYPLVIHQGFTECWQLLRKNSYYYSNMRVYISQRKTQSQHDFTCTCSWVKPQQKSNLYTIVAAWI